MKKSETNTAVPPIKKRKSHFFLLVIIMGLVFMLFGQALGELILLPVQKHIPFANWGVRFLFLYLSFIGIDLLVLIYCALFEKEIFRGFRSAKHGGGHGNTLKNLALGLLIGFLMNGICILIAWLHGDLHFSVGRFQLLYLICALLSVFVQSAAEELVTRGYMLSALRERYNIRIAIAVNALFFGALHLFNNGITVVSLLEIVCIGIALSLVVHCFGSLWMAIAIHTAWNFTQNFLFGLPNSGVVSASSFLHLDAASGSPFYDAVFGVEGAIPAVVVTVLLSVSVVLYARKKSVKF